MPTYEFHCDVCDTTVESFRKMSDREFNPFCAGDFVIDNITGDSAIENGMPHEIAPMRVMLSRNTSFSIKGPRYA